MSFDNPIDAASRRKYFTTFSVLPESLFQVEQFEAFDRENKLKVSAL